MILSSIVLKRCLELETNFKVEYIKTKNGLDNIKIDDYLLHSMYDPYKEGESFVENKYKIGSTHILFGYGCGYIVEAFLKRIKDQDRLIVIEPILTNIKTINGDYELIQSQDYEDIITKLKSLLNPTDYYTVFSSLNYDKIMPELFKKFLIDIKDLLYISKTNENTIMSFSNEWQRNYILNLEHVLRDDSLTKLHNKIKKPIIIASAGPSLTKQIPLLKKYRDSVIIVSAGSTINTLLNEGIEADFIISIDGTLANYNHFKDTYFKNSRFIYLLSSYPEIRKSFEKTGYFLLGETDEVFGNHLQNIIGEDVVRLKGGGSVSNYALSISLYISSGPIALIGQDLAFTNNQSHAANNKSFHEIDVNETLSKGYFYSEGYYGDKVLTNYAFLAMKKSFESIIQTVNNREIFNCSEGGIRLNGFEQIPFEQFLKKYTIIDSSELVVSNGSEVNMKQKIRMIEILQEEVQKYNKIKRLLIDNIKLINSNQSNKFFSNSILKKMDQNDIKIQDTLKETCIASIMDPINLEVIKNFKPRKIETPEQSYERIKLQNLTLYKKTITAVEKTQEFMEILFKRLKEI